jgi:predicted ATPase/Tfp pilus assembly protein PilF
VLHLSGHGTGAGDLVLEKTSGEGHCLSASEVVKLLPATPDRCPQLVVIAMCHSGEAGEALHRAGVRHVVAIERDYPIYDRAATAYARGFYAALARGDRLAEAHEDGCRAAALEPYTGDRATACEGLPSSERFRFFGNGRMRLVRKTLRGRPRVNPPQLPEPQPQQVSPLVGRAYDLIAVNEMLVRDTWDANRLLTVHGTGGVGKTVLAQALARFWWERAHFADGVRVVSFEDVEGGRRAVELLLRAFELAWEPRPGEDEDQARLRALVAYLATREMLLVLDNCETVDDDLFAHLIRDLLGRCPRLRLLATSRRPLGLGGALEQTRELGPLTVDYAVKLFRRRAQAEGIHLPPGLKTDSLVAAICQEVDCIPLAVELVAMHTRAYALTDILADLRETALRLPAAERKGVPERHKGLRISFDYTFRRLSTAAKRLFCAMSCFRGGAGLMAVRAVGGEWAPALEELVNWSLVRRQDGRYAMLPTVEEYAAERLATDATELEIDVQSLRRRHAEHYLTTARRFDETSMENWRALEPDLDNIAMGFETAIAEMETLLAASLDDLLTSWEPRLKQRTKEGEGSLAGEYALALKNYVFRRRPASGERWLRAGLVAWAAAEHGQRVGLFCNELGLIYDARGDYAAALAWYEKSVAINEQLGNQAVLAATYNNIGEVHRARGDYDAALGWYGKSVAIKEKLGDLAGLATTYNNIGLIHDARGDYDAALEWYMKDLAISEKLGDLAGLAATYNNIGQVHYARGDYAAALEWMQRSLDIFERLGAKASAATVRENIEVLKEAMSRK